MSEQTAMPDKMVPHNVEAEQAVLGALLIDPDAIYKVSTFLRADDFYVAKHEWMYESVTSLHERGEAVDYVTLCDELERREQLAEIGGAAYITSLINATPTALNVEYYGRIVERTSTLRRLIGAAGEIAALAYEDTDNADEVVDRAEQILFGVSQRRISRDLMPIREVVSEYYDRIDYLYQHKGETIGVPTGFRQIDKLLGGLQKSDLVIVASRPGMGKTSLMLSFAQNAARKYNQRVAVFSLEMSAEQLVQRLIASETGIDSQRLRLGNLREEEWPVFIQATGALSETMIFIDDTPSISAMQLRTKARRLYAEHGLDLIIVDYLQLMQTDRRIDNRVQEISLLSRSLKGLARELNIPVVVASQLSRAVEQRNDKHPMLSDLRESGCLTGDTLITLADNGIQVPISDLVGKSDLAVWALNHKTMKIERAIISNAFPTGVKPTYRLTTGLGRSIKATGNHKFLTIHGWKRLDELERGDRIALPRTLPSPHEQTMGDTELALLAHLIGDGCTLPRHAIQYTTKEKDLAETVTSLATEIFGGEIRPRLTREHNWYQVYLPTTRQITHGVRNPISEWLDNLGIFGLRSHEKHVPRGVFEQPQEAIALFLRHLWATDGCIKLTKSGEKYIPRVYYASSSQQLARDVQTLLLRLEINARLRRVVQHSKGRDQYHVILSGRSDLERFANTIGAVGRSKRQGLEEIERYIEDRPANTNRDTIPNDIWRMYAVPSMRKHGITTRQMQSALGNSYCGTSLYKRNVGRERAAKLARVVKSEEISCLAESDLYWDKIEAIHKNGAEEVFDLTVPGHHNFEANGVIVHNSIEQDADVVVFIYRDEYYSPETDQPNIAEIIVSKHRNGPTGMVPLFFKKELAKFCEVEIFHEDLEF